MKVTLIDRTQDALELLLFTKNTRLQSGEGMAEVRAWPEEKKLAELAYMRDTIKSSWEFVNYTFLIEGVSRAFTHQLVRTRTGHYAQESQRTVDVRENGVVTPDGLEAIHRTQFLAATDRAIENYCDMVDDGVPVQDARGALPIAISTSIIASFSLRTLHEMAIVRLCTRTQGEYQDVFRAMKAEVVAVHPWAEPFIRVGCATNGICVFPRYTQCPIYPLTYNASGDVHKERVAEIAAKVEAVRHEAQPQSNKGRTM